MIPYLNGQQTQLKIFSLKYNAPWIITKRKNKVAICVGLAAGVRLTLVLYDTIRSHTGGQDNPKRQ